MRVLLDLPDDIDPRQWLGPMLDALTAVNVAWLRAHPAAPSILSPSAGVRYTREPYGEEEWRTLPAVLSAGAGDCEDLAAARAAELIVAGVRARAVPIHVNRGSRIGGPDLWHIVVRLPDGRTEDPSAALGMAGPA